MSIVHLKRDQIEDEKWNNCIQQSDNPLIYATSWYLDVVSPKWEALISDDYKAVFPLPVKSKLGIKYIAHPLFCQQLGLFKTGDANVTLNDIFSSIPHKYRRQHLRLNSLYPPESIKYTKRKNYVLSLNRTLEDIESGFNENTKKECQEVS